MSIGAANKLRPLVFQKLHMPVNFVLLTRHCAPL